MSRLEKNLSKREKKKKLRLIFKALFILTMITNLMICVLIIDKSAKDMLGSDAYLLNSSIDNIKNDINEKISEIYKVKDKVIKLYNDAKSKT